MSFLERTFYHNTVEKWLIAAAAALAVALVIWIVKKILYRKIDALSQRTKSNVDDLAALLIRKTKKIFPAAISVYCGTLLLTLPRPITIILSKATVLVLLFQAGIWGAAAVSFRIEKSREKKNGDIESAAMVGFLNYVVRGALWTVVILIALDHLGVRITTLIAGLGVGGVAVALAVQNILGDLFASLSIILDKPFGIGDFIVIDEFSGTVEHVGMKTTRLRSLTGEQLVFSNSDLLKSRIRNYERMAERRVLLVVGVVHRTPPEKLAAIPGLVREIIQANPRARFERAHFRGFGPYSLEFEIIYWVKDSDYAVYMDVQQDVNLAVFRKFRSEGVEFAYPTQTLFLKNDGPGKST
jgi:small-conductance mechanosensitive channel